MSQDNRKISDVVLEMEEKLRFLSGSISNIDNNMKLVLSRLNELNKKLEPKVIPSPKQYYPQNEPERIPATKSNIMVAKPVSYDDEELDEFGNPELTEDVAPIGKRRVARGQGESKKVSVSQQISFPDGRPIFLAHVEVLKPQPNKDPVLIKQTRTNQKGKWLAALEPGEYVVHIMKRQSADNSRLPVELRYSIEIPESGGPMELPSPELPDVYKEK